MSIRDILVYADPTDASRKRVKFAATLAQRLQAHLTGVFATQTIAYQYLTAWSGYAAAPMILPEELVRDYTEAMDKAAAEARAHFEATAGRLPASVDWLTINGDFAVDMIACMRRADLTIFPKERLPNLAESGLEPALLGLSSGGPLILTPDEVTEEASAARRILICWDGRREAARALQDAWPLITAAEQVSVLIVSKELEGAGDPGLLRRLAHHGVKAELVVKEEDRAAAGEAILQQIGERRADLVVMGLYGHTRARELVLGGASREVLKHTPVPLFMSH